MKITSSILNLTKTNNGFFKSDKQAKFLISQISEFGGCVGHSSSAYHSCPIFAEYDEKGIIKLTKSTKKGDVVIFERNVKGVISSLDAKRLKSLERKMRSISKEIKERDERFKNGSYNSSGDTSTYTELMIKGYNHFQNIKRNQVEELKKIIQEINEN